MTFPRGQPRQSLRQPNSNAQAGKKLSIQPNRECEERLHIRPSALIICALRSKRLPRCTFSAQRPACRLYHVDQDNPAPRISGGKTVRGPPTRYSGMGLQPVLSPPVPLARGSQLYCHQLEPSTTRAAFLRHSPLHTAFDRRYMSRYRVLGLPGHGGNAQLLREYGHSKNRIRLKPLLTVRYRAQTGQPREDLGE